ncbi:MAG: acetylxylan esterase [Clostridia bacterium]|nr:acetylxylan esterase [Clostridia bacterium]
MNKYRQLEMQKRTNSKKEEYKYFVGTTLKHPLEYEIGEKMVFKIRVRYMDDCLDIPYIWYNLLSDDGQNVEGYLEKADDGWFYIEGSISKSGFVYVQAKACDENKEIIPGIAVYNGSAGADVKNVLRGTKTPDDYVEFWDNLKAQVEATEPEVLYCEKIEDEKHPDFEMFDMRIKAPGSDYVGVAVAYPKNAEKGSLKFLMDFQGYGVYPTNPQPRAGYFTLLVNGHSIPNRGTDEFFADIRDNQLKGYGYDEEENKRPETTYWVKMLLRDLQAIRFFKDHELLNKKDYIFYGSSQGGMQACNIAAHFDRSSALIMNVPWLADIDGQRLCGRRPNKMPKGHGVTYFDTAVAAQFLKCPVYFISGLGDPTCNSSTQMSLFNAIKSPKYVEFYQNKVHSFTIPWDENMYPLGDLSLADKYRDLTDGLHELD